MGAGGPLSGPAQMLSNAINNGTLRFDRGGDDDEDNMDTDEVRKNQLRRG